MNALYAMSGVSVSLGAQRGTLNRFSSRPDAAITILNDITLSIEKGGILGLIGESGSGKTTLARAMLGLQKTSGGELRFEDRELRSKSDFAKLRRASSLMFQDPVASLSPRMTVGSLITEPFVIHGIAMQDRKKQAADLLDRVGLPASIAARYPHELSGGQARRVCVARALALNPRFVIADEPTAGLDVSVQGEILNLMTGLRESQGLSFMIITHNLALVRHVSDRVAILYLGCLVETGPTGQVFARPLHPYTMSLIASEPQPDPRKRRMDLAIKGEIPSILARPKGCEFHTRCRFAQPGCSAERPPLRQVAPGRMVRCHFSEQFQ